MRRSLPALALTLGTLLAGCDDPVEPDLSSACLPAVRVEGSIYTLVVDETVPAASVVQEPVYAQVERVNTECADTPGAESEPWMDGDSNFLPRGTTLHRVTGTSPTDRLAVFYEDAWRPLSREP